MLVFFIMIFISLVIFNIMIWIYDDTRLTSSITKSKKILKIGAIVTLITYTILTIGIWIYTKM
jgi:heme A synthase